MQAYGQRAQTLSVTIFTSFSLSCVCPMKDRQAKVLDYKLGIKLDLIDLMKNVCTKIPKGTSCSARNHSTVIQGEWFLTLGKSWLTMSTLPNRRVIQHVLGYKHRLYDIAFGLKSTRRFSLALWYMMLLDTFHQKIRMV